MKVAAAIASPTQGLAPFSLKDAPSFIERQLPVGRLSVEAYKERKAGAGQTLTALGSYWKGRKPLILVRAVLLGSLLPASDDAAADLDIFLKLMAMDDAAFGRRFNGSASEFARLFPEHAERVAFNRTRAWRSDLGAKELKARAASVRTPIEPGDPRERLLKALATFAKSGRATKPSVSAVEFAEFLAHRLRRS
jgi:putative DNA methylase